MKKHGLPALTVTNDDSFMPSPQTGVPPSADAAPAVADAAPASVDVMPPTTDAVPLPEVGSVPATPIESRGLGERISGKPP